jgi:hypothetical protein
MTDRTLRTISQRLSLRKPQADSLEILGEILERVTIGKRADLASTLKTVQALCSEFGWFKVEDFELSSHRFASLWPPASARRV